MMVSKIIIFITVFVAVCFRNSEGTTIVKRCYNDNQFFRVSNDNRNKCIVPILVKSDTYDDGIIVKSLKKSNFGTIIILHADKKKCPASIEYFKHYGGDSYPVLFFMINGQLYDKVWYSTMDLDKFCFDVTNDKNVKLSTAIVANIIQEQMMKKNPRTVSSAELKRRADLRARDGKIGAAAGASAALATVAGLAGIAAGWNASGTRELRKRLFPSEASNQRGNVDGTMTRNTSTGRSVNLQPQEEERRRSTSRRSEDDSEILERNSKRNRNISEITEA